MKYLILLGDGMADYKIKELGNKTPLEYANTPNMDRLASGMAGLFKTVPDGMPPGSDVANLSTIGYNPKEIYTGRAPIEALAKDILLDKDDVAYRCNFVTIENDIMKDFSASHIDSNDAKKLIDLLNEQLKLDNIKFFAGVSYRNLMIWKNGKTDSTTPPHDITDKNIQAYLPKDKAKDELIKIMQMVKEILKNPINTTKANAIWLWGEGKAPKAPSYKEVYGIEGAVISAVDLMKGIAKLLGLSTPCVEGATGFIDTNYEGKINAAYEALKLMGFAYVHIEAPDEAGHMGDLDLKIKAIELFDKKIVSPALDMADEFELKIACLPDHPTPISLKTHTSDPVPFAVWRGEKGTKEYCESMGKDGLFLEGGQEFGKLFFSS
ncbi:putative homoserine kinase-like [Desulfurella amilsii]|uniref:Putative homoserine kinase-like n=1 Tax=Desulfurella amilsii TaxID=1562698 RepID=A0A1X4XYR9_9BACT|nr:cofactor-independent phosphoglycerate mutase [Desulfurella amilsii]OSS42675.1 putative homoserine kinase-like [Desulfurella amilsii]